MFITLEGGEGSGKTSVAKIIYDELIKYKDCILINDPGGTDTGMSIRKILLDPKFKNHKITELYLYHASRAQLVQERIIPALKEDQIVICDRFFDSTHVYQGKIRGWDRDCLEFFDNVTNGFIIPNITILCNVDAEIGLKRSLKTNSNRVNGNGADESRWELEGLEIHKKINAAFYDRMMYRKGLGHNIYIVDSNNRTIAAMADEVLDYIWTFIKE